MQGVRSLDIGELTHWPLWLRCVFFLLLLGVSAIFNWAWQIYPLQQEQKVLAHRQAILQPTIHTVQPLPKPKKAQEIQEFLATLALTHGVLLQEMTQVKAVWTLRFSGTYQGLQEVVTSLAQGPLAWDLHTLQWHSQPSLQLSMAISPIAWQQTLSPAVAAKPNTIVTTASAKLKRKNLFAQPAWPRDKPLGKKPVKSVALPPRPKPVNLQLLGIVGFSSGGQQAVVLWQGKTHIVKVGSRVDGWQVSSITGETLTLENRQAQPISVQKLHLHTHVHDGGV